MNFANFVQITHENAVGFLQINVTYMQNFANLNLCSHYCKMKQICFCIFKIQGNKGIQYIQKPVNKN